MVVELILKEVIMGTLTHPCIDLHTTEIPQPSVPSWFAETVLIAEYLRTHGFLQAISDQVRLVRGRCGQYEVIDFLVLLFGYAISGERTLEAYFARLAPFAAPFMALFERDQMPHRATLSRFLGDVDDACLTALRSLFVSSTFGWGWTQESLGGLKDRGGWHAGSGTAASRSTEFRIAPSPSPRVRCLRSGVYRAPTRRGGPHAHHG
jgi:hypothetical protein